MMVHRLGLKKNGGPCAWQRVPDSARGHHNPDPTAIFLKLKAGGLPGVAAIYSAIISGER
jgi:hypothetical protein